MSNYLPDLLQVETWWDRYLTYKKRKSNMSGFVGMRG
jgi:hypothetical protein